MKNWIPPSKPKRQQNEDLTVYLGRLWAVEAKLAGDDWLAEYYCKKAVALIETVCLHQSLNNTP